jgi:triacylglycerol esterase/lipase EstA (alpha/beta hydrolase family)
MGVLSARQFVKNLGGDGRVAALITLGGTNHGTTTGADLREPARVGGDPSLRESGIEPTLVAVSWTCVLPS